MYALFVTIKIKPGYAEQFKEASLGDAQGSVRDEAGCGRLPPCTPNGGLEK